MERRQTQAPEKVGVTFDTEAETRLNNLSSSEEDAVQRCVDGGVQSADIFLSMDAIKNLFPVPLGKDGTATGFTTYFLLIRNSPMAQVGHVYALRQGLEGGHVLKMFDGKDGKKRQQVYKTLRPAKVEYAGQGDGPEASSKWTLVEKGIVD